MTRVIKHILTTTILVVISMGGFAQIKLNGKSVICEGDLGSFSFTPPTGKTVSAYTWDFGDTYTSNNANPSHLFKKQGTYTVKLNVVYSSGQKENFSLPVDVVDLPSAAIGWVSTNDTCHYTNKVCFTDNSKPASSTRPIQKRTYFWGDGRYDESLSPSFGDKDCHSYYVPDSFYVQMEIVDKLGCKATVSRNVTIVNSVVSKFSTRIKYPNCDSAEVCLTNVSTSSSGSKVSYVWNFDDSTSTNNHFSADQYCRTFTKSKKIKPQLIATSHTGCSDTFDSDVDIQLPGANRSIQLDEKTICYGSRSFIASIDLASGENISWTFNGKQGPSFAKWNYNFSNDNIKPGVYKLSCEISRTGCRKTYSEWVAIRGPVADIKIFNQLQCESNRKVFFVDRSTYVDSSNTVSKWILWDNNGDNCVINRQANENKYKNCNTTIGWFGKHKYSSIRSSNPLTYIITDTATGCSDRVSKNIDLKACGECTALNGRTITLCEDGIFMPNSSPGNGNPIKFSLDTGQTWLPFPSKLNGKYSGMYKVGLIFHYKDSEWVEEIGDDSIRVHSSPYLYIDTLFIDDLLYVEKTKKDTVTFNFEKGCDPYVIQAHFSTGTFYPGESLTIEWGDQTYKTYRFVDTIRQKVFKHVFENPGGSGVVKITWNGKGGCSKSYSHYYTYGIVNDFKVKGNPCLNEEICLEADVRNYRSSTRWDSTNNYGKIHWLLNGTLLDTGFKTCYTFDSVGEYRFDQVAIPEDGCADTLSDTLRIYDVKAGIKEVSMQPFCDGQRTLWDSSSTRPVGNFYTSIDRYYWDFGTGVYSSYDRNPTVAFDGAKKNLLIRHMVVTDQGCQAETSFNLRILASKPLFTPQDAIGCAPFDAIFKNQTQGANQYIWEVGDTNNLTIQFDSLEDLRYTYQIPGEYFVRLIGVDSFLNTKTGDIETCHTIYPPLNEQGVKVLVLPSTHQGILGPDTLCMDESAVFTSLSYDLYDSEIWKFSSSPDEKQSFGGKIVRSFSTPGDHVISIVPKFMDQDVVPRCIQTIEKGVHVVDVNADFITDPSYSDPTVGFINFSTPRYATFLWTFGQPSSGANDTSTLFEPTHDYGTDTGSYNVCLITSVAHCKDTVCNPIRNSYVHDSSLDSRIKLYNVFTPGAVDGSNDAFIIDIVNQASHELTIYNRWGELVFESYKSMTQNDELLWNGRLQNSGPPCPSGTYFYVLKYTFQDEPSEEKTVSGTVTLIR